MDFINNNISSSSNKQNFYEFLLSNISITVIAGIFSYRLINSFFDYIIFPLLDITILPDKEFAKFSKSFSQDKHEEDIKDILDYYNNNKCVFRFGLFIKELIMWLIVMIILFIIYRFT